MSQRLHDELDELAGTPPRPLDAEQVLETLARRRRRRAQAVGAVVGVGCLAAVTAIVPRLGAHNATTSSGVALAPSSAAAASGTAASGTDTSTTASAGQAGAPVTCPTPRRSVRVVIDWAPLVVWQGQKYDGIQAPRGVRLGAQVFTVGCSIGTISDNAQEPVPEPWPDTTATLLRVGTPVHSVVGEPIRCVLAAREQNTTVVFSSRLPGCPHAFSTPSASGRR